MIFWDGKENYLSQLLNFVQQIYKRSNKQPCGIKLTFWSRNHNQVKPLNIPKPTILALPLDLINLCPIYKYTSYGTNWTTFIINLLFWGNFKYRCKLLYWCEMWFFFLKSKMKSLVRRGGNWGFLLVKGETWFQDLWDPRWYQHH